MTTPAILPRTVGPMADDDHGIEDHDRGFSFDLQSLVGRRRALALFGGAGLVGVVAACGGSNSTSTNGAGMATATSPTTEATSGATSTGVATDGSCTVIPEETAGPYPGDGSNGPDVLRESGVVRSDITSSFGSSSGLADGVPVDIVFTLVDAVNGCVPLVGAAVYAWHCDAEGRYSRYSQGVTGENYLRGVQESDGAGQVRFNSIVPGCYSGRWPHVHFEVYPSLAAATDVSNKIATSQIAVPQAICEEVYADSRYPSSAGNLGRISLASDNVFGDDGGVHELATVTGSVGSGLTLSLQVAV